LPIKKAVKEKFMQPLYRFGWTLFRIWAALTGVKIIGRENIPQNQEVVVVGNHTSYMDPLIVGMAFPYELHFLAKSEFSRNNFIKKLFMALGVIFLKRDESDLVAMKRAVNVLKQKEAICIFAEGRRNLDKELGSFKQGAVFIANLAQAPIIPVAVYNSTNFFRFWKRNVVIKIGELITIPHEKRPNRELLEEYTDLLHQRIDSLLATPQLKSGTKD